MGTAASSTWPSTFQSIKQCHDRAYTTIEQAICLETDKPTEALEKYKEGLALINQTLSIQVTRPDNPDDTFQEACKMIEKIKRVRDEITSRIRVLEAEEIPQELPPSYEQATSGSTTPTSLYIANLEMEIPNEPGELLYSCANVRLYFIGSDGIVTQTSKFGTLRIICYKGIDHQTDLLILEIDNWSYPLIPTESPCFKTDYGAFILPDLHASPGCSVGIILPSDTPPQEYELVENIFFGVNQTQLSEIQSEATGISQKISSGILTGAYYLSMGMIKGATQIGELLNRNTPGLISNLTPAQKTKEVNTNVARGMQIAQNTTLKVANVTSFVAERVGYATQALGSYLAPYIQQTGSKLLTLTFHMSQEEAAGKMEGVLNVAAGAIEGFATVYSGLESSASILGNSISSNTVKIVEHKYGSNTAQVTNDAFNTVGNIISIRQNTKYFTPKRVVKITAKEAGKAMIREHKTSQTVRVYPNLNGLKELERNIDKASTSKCDN